MTSEKTRSREPNKDVPEDPVFVCLCLSPAIDVTVFLHHAPQDGEVLKVTREVVTAGGKGLNVARFLSVSGCTVVCGGLLGQDDRELFNRSMASTNINDAFLRLPGETRRNEMIVWPEGQYKLNRQSFPGVDASFFTEDSILHPVFSAPVIKERYASSSFPAADAFDAGRDPASAGEAACTRGRYGVAVLSGTLPAACPSDFYARIGKTLRAHGFLVVLDTSGDALAAGVHGRPDLIKPNADECEVLTKFRPTSPSEFRTAVVRLLDFARSALLSDGAGGCWFAEGDTVLHAAAPSVAVVDTTGAGDVLLAEFCRCRYQKHLSAADALKRAVAAGTAEVEQPGAEPPSAVRIDECACHVTVGHV